MPIFTISVLTLLLSTLLVLGSYWLHVEDDPRVEAVEAMLPHTNCGGCGYPGCRAFAAAVVAGDAVPAACTVGTPDDHLRIAVFLGIGAGSQERRIARLACAGGANVARNRTRYSGTDSCAAAALVAGGGKSCFWGCLGSGDCESACGFDAIQLNEHRLPIVDEALCTGCGDCVTACPKDLFSLQPISQRLWVACKSQLAGDEILEACEVACTGCERCARDTPALIHMSHNLPVIEDPRRQATIEAIQSCPTGAIVWLDRARGPLKGRAARPVIRHQSRLDAAT